MNGFASRLWLLGVTSISISLLGGVACSSGGSSRGGSGGTAATGGNGTGGGGGIAQGTGGLGGATSTGGTAGTTAGGAAAVMCLPATTPLLLDFATVGAGGNGNTQAAFGDYTNVFSGGTFSYPDANITSDVTGGNWHMTGSVADYSGFGIYLGNCQEVDFSNYGGFQFTISGTAPSATPGTLTFGMGTAADSIAYDWFVQNAITSTPNFGRCFPTASQYDGSCGDPKMTVNLSTTPTVVTVHWADLMGGAPDATVNPAEITSIWWSFPWAGATDTAYDIDITVDDIQLVP